MAATTPLDVVSLVSSISSSSSISSLWYSSPHHEHHATDHPRQKGTRELGAWPGSVYARWRRAGVRCHCVASDEVVVLRRAVPVHRQPTCQGQRESPSGHHAGPG